jgi:hypothetical protein
MVMEICAFSKCRNERLRLPVFLEHYRRLGVSRFYIADNGSTDGSADYLSGQPDVSVHAQPGSFRLAEGGTNWLNGMLAEFGVDRWCLTIDIDELLYFPGSERAPLPVLTAYLDGHGYQALSCLLLDVYPAGSLRDCRYQAGADIFSIDPHFDRGPYSRRPTELCPGVIIRGGMRERVFYPEFRSRRLGARISRWLRRRKPPCLTKVPLVRWDKGSRYLHSNHFVSPRVVAPETGVLLHLKFLQDFHARALAEVRRGEYYKSATEYRRYAETLERNPAATLMHRDAVRFEGAGQLVRLGLMTDSASWSAYRQEAAP